jgi:hypothetical protein
MLGPEKRRTGLLACSFACGVVLLLSPSAQAQQKPLVREFAVGTTSRYRILLTVRTEVEGQQPVQIGAKTYVKPFARSAKGDLSWSATRRVVSVGADGTAEIEEILDGFSLEVPTLRKKYDRNEQDELQDALSSTLDRWLLTEPRTLRYREARTGQLSGLPSDAAPPLDEEAPRVLSLWLLRALRPAVALPNRPPGASSWQEPRGAPLPNWADSRGSEAGEWLEAPQTSEPAVRLHVVQQISATVVSGADKPPEGTAHARFHGESLNTLSLVDLHLLGAARSATREITWTLAPVEGLPEPPQFRGRLTVEVQIEFCDEAACLSDARSDVR